MASSKEQWGKTNKKEVAEAVKVLCCGVDGVCCLEPVQRVVASRSHKDVCIAAPNVICEDVQT